MPWKRPTQPGAQSAPRETPAPSLTRPPTIGTWEQNNLWKFLQANDYAEGLEYILLERPLEAVALCQRYIGEWTLPHPADVGEQVRSIHRLTTAVAFLGEFLGEWSEPWWQLDDSAATLLEKAQADKEMTQARARRELLHQIRPGLVELRNYLNEVLAEADNA
jgi:hypothetical protein